MWIGRAERRKVVQELVNGVVQHTYTSRICRSHSMPLHTYSIRTHSEVSTHSHRRGQTHLSCKSAPAANQLRRRRRPAELTLRSAGAIAQPSARQPASPAWHPKASQGNGGHRAWADAPQPSPIEDVHAFAIAITIGLIGALRNTAGTGRSSARQTRRARAIGAGL